MKELQEAIDKILKAEAEKRYLANTFNSKEESDKAYEMSNQFIADHQWLKPALIQHLSEGRGKTAEEVLQKICQQERWVLSDDIKSICYRVMEYTALHSSLHRGEVDPLVYQPTTGETKRLSELTGQKFTWADFEKGLMLAGHLSPANEHEAQEKEALGVYEATLQEVKPEWWVSVNTPPEVEGRYLATGGGHIETMNYHKGKWLYSDGNAVYDWVITHWCDLPAAPVNNSK